MEDKLIQLLLVLFLGAVATYDTLKSRKRRTGDNSDKTGEFFKFQS